MIFRKCILNIITILFIAVLIVSCQPTPDTPPVVYRGEGLPEGCVIDAAAEESSKEIDAPSHWTEETDRAQNLAKIVADADIIVPDISNTPLLELSQVALTENKLKELIEYFAGNARLYEIPAMTKDELELQKEMLNSHNGKFHQPTYYSYIEKYTKNLEEIINSAPESVTKKYIDEIAFDYPVQNEEDTLYMKTILGVTDDEMTAKNSFAAMVETDGAVHPKISATNYNTDVGSSSSFYYEKGTVITKSDMISYSSNIQYEQENRDGMYAISDDALESLVEYYEDITNFISENEKDTDKKSAQEIADKIVAELGPKEMVLCDDSTEIAVNLPDTRWDKEFNEEIASIAYTFTYHYAVENVPCFMFSSSTIGADASSLPEQVYSPPCMPEEIKITIADDEVYCFEWTAMAEVVGSVAVNTKLLPFDEVKDKYLDHVGYQASYMAGGYPEPDGGFFQMYDVTEVELSYFYTTAYNNPQNMWLVPVWIFHHDIYLRDYSGETTDGRVFMMPDVTIMSAIDGGYIMP